jgi:exonuclease VII large subunit
VIGYTLWPADYAELVRSRGFDVIAETIAPPRPPRAARVATTGSAVPSDAASDVCDQPADLQAKWPASRVEQVAQMSNAQHDALDKLQAALAQAATTIRAGCHDTAALNPRERLHLLVQQLWAVRDAGTSIRAPLSTFYDLLNETQKAAFTNQQQAAAPRDARTANTDMGQQAQACAARSGDDSEWMLKRIEQTIRPTKQQRAVLESLRKSSSDMAKLLAVSCTQPVPADPLARLDDAEGQLTRMNYAATSMEIAVNGFYAQLDEQQKAKFNALGR